MRRLFGLTGLCLLSSLLTNTAKAQDVLYNNLGPGDTYLEGIGWTILGANRSGGPQTAAMPFTVNADASVTQIDLGLTHYDGTNSVNVSLVQDSAGLPSSTMLATTFFTGLPTLYNTNSILQTWNLTAPVVATAGSKYWVVVSAGGADSYLQWNLNTTNAVERGAVSFQGGSWGVSSETPVGAMRVTGIKAISTAVPEPGTLALLGLALPVIGLVRRRKA